MDIEYRLQTIGAYSRGDISWKALAHQLSESSPFEEGTSAYEDYASHALTMDTFLGLDKTQIDDYKTSILEIESLLTKYLPASHFYLASNDGIVILNPGSLGEELRIGGFAVQEVEVLGYYDNETAFQYFTQQDSFTQTEYVSVGEDSLLLFQSDTQSEALEVPPNAFCVSLHVSSTAIAIFMKGNHVVR